MLTDLTIEPTVVDNPRVILSWDRVMASVMKRAR
jgi:hypothetical protein